MFGLFSTVQQVVNGFSTVERLVNSLFSTF